MRWIQESSGVAMVLTLLTLVVLLTVSAGLVAVVHSEYRNAALALDALQASFLAEAGVERAIFELDRDPDWQDARGATALRGTGGDFSPICLDPEAAGGCGLIAHDLAFPADEPVGRLRILWRPGDCEGCVEVRAIGSVRAAVRSVRAVLRRNGSTMRVSDWREEL